MKLFYTKQSCSLVCRIIINEINFPCEFESVDLRSKKTETNMDFYSINPKGSVPVLQLDNGELLTENAIILQYLADTSNTISLLPAIGDFKRYRVLEWLNYTATEIHKSFGPLFNPTLSQEIKEQIFIPLLKNKFKYISKHLEHNKYLLGDQFTLPDAYMFVMITWASHFNLNLTDMTHLSRYFNELKQRKSIQKSLEEES
jgi:glutathione S-transferase